MSKQPNGYIVWEDAQRVAIVTGVRTPSINDKTGPMAQLWIIVKKKSPIDAWRDGTDHLVCGGCPFRRGGALEVACYVNKGFGPAAVYRAWLAGSYPTATPEEVGDIMANRGIGIRLGAYGDPAFVPTDVLVALTLRTFSTGYTHQWQEPWFDPEIFRLVMASTDDINTVAKLHELHGTDVRYYRVSTDGAAPEKDEVACPSKREGKRAITCNACKLCAGNRRSGAKNVVIQEGN